MNILVIDDDYNKINDLSDDILSHDPESKIRYVNNFEQAMTFITENKDYIDLIILDWCFPPDAYSRSKYAMGRQVINAMKFDNIDVKTIICSSDVISIDKNEYPFVLGAITYCFGLSVYPYINSLVNPNKEESVYIGQPRVLKKTKQDTGYKRKMSSTPWWVK